MAFGIVPASRGSLMGVLFGAWLLAGAMSAAILSGSIDPAGLLPSVFLAVLGYNAGIGMGYGLTYAASLKAVRY